MLFASIHSYLDPSSGAALATRELLELLASREILLTYGGHPVCRDLMIRARAKGTAVVTCCAHALMACSRATAVCAARTADAPLEGCGRGCAFEPRRSAPTTGISAPAEAGILRVSRN